MVDVDSLGDLHEEVACQEFRQPDGVEVLLGLTVGDYDRDEVLGHAAAMTPALSEPQDEEWRGGLSLDEGVVLERRPEVSGVIKDPCGLVLVDGNRILPGRDGVRAVHDRSAEGGDVDAPITAGVQHDPVAHSVKDVLGKSLRVVFRQDDGVSELQLLLVLWGGTSIRAIRDDTTRPL